MSIPQTYLMLASSSEDADVVWLILYLLLLGDTILAFASRCSLAPGSTSEKPEPTERASAHAGSAIWPGGSCVRTAGRCNKPHRPLRPWRTGSCLSKAGHWSGV
jgi:hypothetical protein